MGNLAEPSTLPALLEVLRDKDPVLRHHAAWALGRFRRLPADTIRAMKQAADFEHDPWVYDEIVASLAGAAPLPS
jgi:epoxyqueuosine reductase